MRFPLQLMTGKEYHSHHNTLLDGELVVDEETDSGKHFYQFLVYDIMAINCKPVVHLPWKVQSCLKTNDISKSLILRCS